jgi:uncharacterized protein with FMN-binding domain
MKSSIRNPALVLAAAAISGAAVIGSAHANYWSLFSSPTSQNSQPAPTEAAPAANGDPPLQLAATGGHYRDGSYTGPIVDSYYGEVQVQANIRGNRLESVDVLQYPADRRASRSINDRALPVLESEVVRAQSTRVNIVSGATLTSTAYLRSLNNALGQAGS